MIYYNGRLLCADFRMPLGPLARLRRTDQLRATRTALAALEIGASTLLKSAFL
jgi:hypothetical protein